MAKAGDHVESIFCSICLDILKDPVTIPCGHSYCMGCIKSHWNGLRFVYRCPQCRKIFKKKPVLVKNTVLSDIVEELKKTELEAVNKYNTGPQDVSCDVCSGKKLKAAKSCLQCLASYCQKHLQPHQDVPPLQRHQLVDPFKNLQDNICPLHNKTMEMFCCTDQQCICYLCSVDQHRGHDLTSSTAEMATKKMELETRRQKIVQRIQAKEKDLKALQQEMLAISRSVNDTVQWSEDSFTQLFRLLEDIRCSVAQQISSLQHSEELRLQEIQNKLEQDITELRTTCAELDSLADSEDPCLFLHNYPAVIRDSENPDPTRVYRRSESCFEEVTAVLSALTDNLHLTLRDRLDYIASSPSPVQELLPEQPSDSLSMHKTQPRQSLTGRGTLLTQFVDLVPKHMLLQPKTKPQSREEFLRYWCGITLDPNTVNTKLLLSDQNKRATLKMEHQKYPVHPDRFSFWFQVLSTEGLTGRCYWEVEWSGDGGVLIAVAYKNIRRDGPSNECGFGHNDKSWALECDRYSYRYSFSGASSHVSGPVSSTIGVYLDHAAGLLSFYSISQTMTLLHRIQTRFTQPLHAGLRLWYPAVTVAFVNPNKKLHYSTSLEPIKPKMQRSDSQVSAVF